jgi:hypothetical protein
LGCLGEPLEVVVVVVVVVVVDSHFLLGGPAGAIVDLDVGAVGAHAFEACDGESERLAWGVVGDGLELFFESLDCT